MLHDRASQFPLPTSVTSTALVINRTKKEDAVRNF